MKTTEIKSGHTYAGNTGSNRTVEKLFYKYDKGGNKVAHKVSYYSQNLIAYISLESFARWAKKEVT